MQDEKVMMITFWQPSRWESNLYDIEGREQVTQEWFLTEIYNWVPAESIWNSIEEAGTTNLLRDQLLDNFSPDKPPEDRRIEHFQGILLQIREIITNDKSAWSDCKQTASVGGDNITLRADILLSFLHHLTWLCDVFKDVPGISISIR